MTNALARLVAADGYIPLTDRLLPRSTWGSVAVVASCVAACMGT